MKNITITLICLLGASFFFQANAQSRVDKKKRSRYFKQQTDIKTDDGFYIDGFEKNYDSRKRRKNIERRSKKQVYDVNIRSKEEVGKYQGERKVNTVKRIMTAPKRKRKVRKRRVRKPVVRAKKNENKIIQNERVIYMTENEKDYATTVVRKRYTSLDILADDIDASKYQRPVFKGICSECDRDVDNIITDKNLSSLEKNYQLKQAYMLRDKRLRETLSVQQYKKWNRIKDEDEYLILTKDPELKDGVYK
jgi:hypothetical protein